MALQYGYFDSEITGHDEEGMPIFDRAQTSDFMALFLSKLVTSGIFALPENGFQVLAGGGLSVKVKGGYALIKGRLVYDKEETALTLETAPTEGTYKRIDRVVLRANYPARICEIVIKKGEASTSPKAPALVQPESGDFYELSLATVQIKGNQTVISQADITDTRMDSAQCGVVTQMIDHLETTYFYDQLRGIVEARRQFQDFAQQEFSEWFSGVQGMLEKNTNGELINLAKELDARLSALEEMIQQNRIIAPIRADDKDSRLLLVDDDGHVIIADWTKADWKKGETV